MFYKISYARSLQQLSSVTRSLETVIVNNKSIQSFPDTYDEKRHRDSRMSNLVNDPKALSDSIVVCT